MKNVEIEIKQLYMSANQFHVACEEIEQIKSETTVPLVVNSALTCELYLKALVMITRAYSESPKP